MVAAIKSYVKNLELHLVDILLIPFTVFGLLVAIESSRLIFLYDGNCQLSQPLWLFCLYSGGFLISICSYIFFEFRKAYKPNNIINTAFLILLLAAGISFLVCPNTIDFDIPGIESPINVSVIISNEIKYIHFSAFCFFVFAIYVGVFIIPRRFTNNNFLLLLCIVIHSFFVIVLIYSFIFDNYYYFFYFLFGDISHVIDSKYYAPCSFFGLSNTLAVFLAFGIIFSILGFSTFNKKYHLYPLPFYYVFLLLTMCKTVIGLATLYILIYSSILFIKSIKNKNKKQTTVLGVFLAGIFVLISMVVIICLSNESIRSKLYVIIFENGILSGRTSLWSIAFQIASSRWVIGYGYGTYNSLLLSATTKQLYAHNWFLSILGKGGIFYLIIYILFLVYSSIILYRLYQIDKTVFVPLLLLFLFFFLHSCVEDSYNFVAISTSIISLCYYPLSKKKQPIELAAIQN